MHWQPFRFSLLNDCFFFGGSKISLHLHIQYSCFRGALRTSLWRFQYIHCVSKHDCWDKLCTLNCEACILLGMIILNYHTELVSHGAKSCLHMSGIIPLKYSNCPYETLSPNTPIFSLRLPLSHHGLLLPGYSPGLLVRVSPGLKD